MRYGNSHPWRRQVNEVQIDFVCPVCAKKYQRQRSSCHLATKVRKGHAGTQVQACSHKCAAILRNRKRAAEAVP